MKLRATKSSNTTTTKFYNKENTTRTNIQEIVSKYKQHKNCSHLCALCMSLYTTVIHTCNNDNTTQISSDNLPY